ncbi:hypothetical protein GQ53DRAFT_819408 [Thozetella sp. PMI_491]|nr:hypothetical protein GQ53DRAFT_819408 [Thozetella sp. PMI_491]
MESPSDQRTVHHHVQETDISEVVIELDDLPLPCDGTQSTDNLIPRPDAEDFLERPVLTPPSARGPSPTFPPVPDYKPIPLRWPFQVFLLLCLGGVFAFLEYEVRSLPMPEFEALNDRGLSTSLNQGVNASLAGRDKNSTPEFISTSSMTTPTFTTAGLVIREPLVAIPTPDPDPRRPKTDYPPGDHRFSTWFQWGSPKWLEKQNWDIIAVVRHVPLWCYPGNVVIQEVIPTTYTDDPSWCLVYPLITGEEVDGNDGSSIFQAEDLDGVDKAADKGCESIIKLIYAYNKLAKRTFSQSATRQWSEVRGLPDPFTTTTWTSTPQVSLPWAPPLVSDSQILLPLGKSQKPQSGWLEDGAPWDAFGPLISSSIGYYPAKGNESINTFATLPLSWGKDRIVSGVAASGSPQSSDSSRVAGSASGEAKGSIASLTGSTLTISASIYTQSTSPGARPAMVSSLPPTTYSYGTRSSSTESLPSSQTATLSVAKPTHSLLRTSTESGIVQFTSVESNPDLLGGIMGYATNNPDNDPNYIIAVSQVPVIGPGGTPLPPAKLDATVATIITLLDSHQVPTATATVTFVHSISAVSILDPSGSLSAISVVEIAPVVTIQTLTDVGGGATATVTALVYPKPSDTGPISPAAQSAFRVLTQRDFLLAAFVPVLCCTVLSIFVQIFCANVRLILPFRALRQPQGATAATSLCLSRRDFLAPTTALQFLRQFKDPLPLLNTLLALLSSLLVAISSETIEIEFKDRPCSNRRICPIGLRKSVTPTRGADALLAAMAILVVWMAILLARCRSGVATAPWSVASIASLLQHDTRNLLLSVGLPKDDRNTGDKQAFAHLEGKKFMLRYQNEENPDRIATYGICVELDQRDKGEVRLTKRNPPQRSPSERKKDSCYRISQVAKRKIILAIFLIALCGVLTLVLYYENTMLDTPFEAFMDSQKMGVRLLFAMIGIIINAFWDHCFGGIADHQLYRILLRKPQTEQIILLSPAATVFTGLWQSIRVMDPLSASVAIAAISAKFTPILLSNVPFRNTVTWDMHEISVWMITAILGYMILILALLLSMNGPDLPAEPDSLAGCMFYIRDSTLPGDFSGISTIGAERVGVYRIEAKASDKAEKQR